MNKKYICYCGLYCENCAVKSKIEPASKILYNEMKKAGFEDIINFIPDGEGFWRFLKSVSEERSCFSCQENSGNPGCTVRICAKEKGIEMCALCKEYPCEKFDEFFNTYSTLKNDNNILIKDGLYEWSKMQDKRKANGFSYTG